MDPAPPLGGMAPETFLETYWQKKPLLIRQAFPVFEPPIEGDDLAGLATDPDVESRLVSGAFEQEDWQLAWGPFSAEDYDRCGPKNWTLLVQHVDKYHEPVARLKDYFDFLPAWRRDDVMISFAAPGGSVGPHVDQYDVFLLQAAGRRRWQIAKRFDEQLIDYPDLKVLARFEPEEEWVLEPGDLLYLPPGVAHHGVALDAGLTYSFGMRAPSRADWLTFLSDHYAEKSDEGGRWSDPDRNIAGASAEVTHNELGFLPDSSGATETHLELLTDFLSRFGVARAIEPLNEPLTAEQLTRYLSRGGELTINPWTQATWCACDEGASLYLAGDHYLVPEAAARLLSGQRQIDYQSVQSVALSMNQLVAMVNSGHWLTDYDSED